MVPPLFTIGGTGGPTPPVFVKGSTKHPVEGRQVRSTKEGRPWGATSCESLWASISLLYHRGQGGCLSSAQHSARRRVRQQRGAAGWHRAVPAALVGAA